MTAQSPSPPAAASQEQDASIQASSIQDSSLQDVPKDAAPLQATVVDSAHKPQQGASVILKSDSTGVEIQGMTDSTGSYEFPSLKPGAYHLHATKESAHSLPTPFTLAPGKQPAPLTLVLITASDQPMEFVDKPNFSVAGVTDWSAVGGHGSDASLRTSEDLARQTVALKPEQDHAKNSKQAGVVDEGRLRAAVQHAPHDFIPSHELGAAYLKAGSFEQAIPLLQAAYDAQPKNVENAYDLAQAYEGAGSSVKAQALVQALLARNDTADLHRLAGEIDEKLGNPLAAVQQEEQAARLDPSEQNYFAWGSELLLHRAVWQAVEVFRSGSKAHPQSSRMLAALGTALFASALYDEAALRLCDAADLNPSDPQPYMFLGKVEMAAPKPLPCVETKLAFFVQQQPGNAYANYLYAMALWKRQEAFAGDSKDPQTAAQAETLLTKAIAEDNKCFEAYLQLGIIYSSEHNYASAVSSYRKAIEADPDLSEAHYRLGVAYDHTGEHDKAKQEFELHAALEKQQAVAIERQRRDVKQFLIVLQGSPGDKN